MALYLFGVTYETVKQDLFPMFDSFSATTNPSSTVVGRFIDEEAGELAGRLLEETIVAATVHALGATYPAYVWCRKTLTLMVGIRILQAATSQYPELARSFRDELDARFERLASTGATALGDETLATGASAPDGPTTHISQHGLTVADPDEMSTAEPVLKKDDPL